MKKLFVLCSLLTAILAFSAPALAGSVEIAGGLALETTWAYESSEARGGDDSLTSLYRFGAGESIIGIGYISDDKKFEGYAELSMYGRSDGLNVECGAAFMVYNGEMWSVMLGFDSHASDTFAPGQVLDDGAALEGYGNSTLDTNEQIRFSYGEKYKFQFSIDAPYKESVWDDGESFHQFPGFTGAMELCFSNVMIHPWARFEYVQWENGDVDDDYYSLDMGLEINGDFGLVGFTAAINYGINTAQNGVVGSADPLLIDGVVDSNVKQLGVWGELRIGGLSLGGGYAVASRDDWDNDPYTMAAYANYAIEFGMITFIPEVVWFNHGEDETGADQGDTVLIGLWSQLEF